MKNKLQGVLPKTVYAPLREAWALFKLDILE